LKARVAGKFYNALDNNEPWAIQMAMRNQFGWDAGRGGFHLEPGAVTDERPETSVNVVFVVPGKKPWHDTLAGPVSGQRLLPAPPRTVQNRFRGWFSARLIATEICKQESPGKYGFPSICLQGVVSSRGGVNAKCSAAALACFKKEFAVSIIYRPRLEPFKEGLT
jgi:hypothetical protein